MYKLLPSEQRKIVASEYSAHRATVMLMALILVIIIGMVGLFPSYILSTARRQEVLQRASVTGDLTLPPEDIALENWLTDFNLKLRTLSQSGEKAQPSTFIAEVIHEKVSGIQLDSFVWSMPKGAISLAVSGVARDRQTLIAFEDKLNSSGHFGSVALPVSNLASDKDINFVVTLSPLKKP